MWTKDSMIVYRDKHYDEHNELFVILKGDLTDWTYYDYVKDGKEQRIEKSNSNRIMFSNTAQYSTEIIPEDDFVVFKEVRKMYEETDYYDEYEIVAIPYSQIIRLEQNF